MTKANLFIFKIIIIIIFLAFYVNSPFPFDNRNLIVIG